MPKQELPSGRHRQNRENKEKGKHRRGRAELPTTTNPAPPTEPTSPPQSGEREEFPTEPVREHLIGFEPDAGWTAIFPKWNIVTGKRKTPAPTEATPAPEQSAPVPAPPKERFWKRPLRRIRRGRENK